MRLMPRKPEEVNSKHERSKWSVNNNYRKLTYYMPQVSTENKRNTINNK